MAQEVLLCRTMQLRLFSKIFLLGSTLGFATAHADGTKLALDLDAGFPLDQPGSNAGGGGMLRLGRSLNALLITVTPEIGAGYMRFGDTYASSVYRGVAGARVAVGKILQPGVFAHLGFAHQNGELPPSHVDISRSAFTYDAGVSLDLTLLPLVDLGAHGAYNCVAANAPYPKYDWLSFGLHAALIF